MPLLDRVGSVHYHGIRPDRLAIGGPGREALPAMGEKHSRTYQHTEETLKRFENFKQNLRYVVEANSNRTGHTVGLNRFADLSNEEFRELYLGKVKIPIGLSERRYTCWSSATACHASRSLDWWQKGAVTAVKDQVTMVANKVVSIDGHETVAASDSDLLCATAHQPVSVGIEGSSLYFQLYTGGIFEGDCSSNPEDLNHTLLIVGYGTQDGKDY